MLRAQHSPPADATSIPGPTAAILKIARSGTGVAVRTFKMHSFYRAAADVIVVLHVGFVLFVVLGGLLAFRWQWVRWVHAPAAVWGVAIELGGWICPLTPLENHLRQLGGASGYEGDFVEHYVLPLLYPVALTRGWQVAFGCFALAVNVALYYALMLSRRRSKRET